MRELRLKWAWHIHGDRLNAESSRQSSQQHLQQLYMVWVQILDSKRGNLQLCSSSEENAACLDCMQKPLSEVLSTCAQAIFDFYTVL